GRIGDDELSLISSVQAARLQRQVFADAIVENSKAAANSRLRGMLRAYRAGRPGKTNAWRKVKITADVVLVLVTQAEAQHQVRAIFPVVLNETAKINLAHRSLWI